MESEGEKEQPMIKSVLFSNRFFFIGLTNTLDEESLEKSRMQNIHLRSEYCGSAATLPLSMPMQRILLSSPVAEMKQQQHKMWKIKK